jgi:hypothetical protein
MREVNGAHRQSKGIADHFPLFGRAAGCSWVNAVEHDIGGRAAGDPDRIADGRERLEVEDLWPDRDQDQVGNAGRFDGGRIGFAGRIDKNEIGPCPFGAFQGLAQTAGLDGLDGRTLRFAAVLPVGGIGLRIEVDHGGPVARALGRNRQAYGRSRFTGPAFLTDDGDHSHAFKIPRFADSPQVECPTGGLS